MQKFLVGSVVCFAIAFGLGITNDTLSLTGFIVDMTACFAFLWGSILISFWMFDLLFRTAASDRRTGRRTDSNSSPFFNRED